MSPIRVLLFLLPLLAPVLQGQQGTVSLGAGAGAPGSVVKIPLTLSLNSGKSLDTISVGVQVVGTGSAPALAGHLGFTADPSLPAPSLVDNGFSVNTLSVAWLSAIDPALTGTRALGLVSVTIPAAATDGQSYTLHVTAASGSNGNTSVPLTAGADAKLTVTVTAVPATIALDHSTLQFTAVAGGSNPPLQFVNVSNTGGGTLSWTATVTGAPWLTLSPSSGNGGATISCIPNISGLTAGTYNGTIQVSAAGATNTPQSVAVTLTVASPASTTISLAPTSLQFVATSGLSPATQTFQVTNSGGSGTLGWTATASTNSGGTWLSVTPASGTAPSPLTVQVLSASLAKGIYQGSISIQATSSSNATNSPQTLAVTLAIDSPAISPNGVVNGASFSTDAVVSPGSIASLFGVNLAGSVSSAADKLTTSLAGTQVMVGGENAPLFYVSPKQINFQVPTDVSGSTVSIVVASGSATSLPATVKMAAMVPGIFTADTSGSGQGAVLNLDYSPNSAKNPTTPGSYVQIFATGLGPTNPAYSTGQAGAASAPYNLTVVQPVVMIGGKNATVSFSGLAPGFVGLYQVNAQVPQGISGDAVPLQIQMNATASNTVTIAVH